MSSMIIAHTYCELTKMSHFFKVCYFFYLDICHGAECLVEMLKCHVGYGSFVLA